MHIVLFSLILCWIVCLCLFNCILTIKLKTRKEIVKQISGNPLSVRIYDKHLQQDYLKINFITDICYLRLVNYVYTRNTIQLVQLHKQIENICVEFYDTNDIRIFMLGKI